MKENKVMIESVAILSDDGHYRYRLTKAWDDKKKKAAVIMLNPSTANELKIDKTFMNVNNFLVDNDFGRFDIVNLFAYMTTKPSQLSNRREEFEKENDKYILEAVEEADIVIVGWIRNGQAFVEERKKEVEKFLLPFKHKLKCFKDEKGKKPRHPCYLTDKWTLVDYRPMF